jgi:phosphohistidine phosphatase
MPPLIYLVRHAHAAEAANDAVRPLSPRGRDEVRALAHLLRSSRAFAPMEAWHSPLVRARETAELLLHELKLSPARRELPELVPEGAPAAVAALLTRARNAVALFGHEPHLSALATLLVTNEAGPIVFTVQKATMIALEPAGAHWSVRWQLSPDLFAL